MDARSKILNAITDRSGSKREPRVELNFQPGTLWEQFETQFQGLGGTLLSHEQFSQQVRGPIWADSAARALLGSRLDRIPVAPTIWEAELGISLGVLAIAQTGSFLLQAGPGRERLSSLIPPVNIIVLKPSDIVGTLAEAIAQSSTRNSVLVTGPSRTADIEGVLVRGIHGPRELMLYRVEGE